MSDAQTLSPLLPDDIETAACHLMERASAAGLKVTTAESCTGGLLASLLTDIEGVSSAFERGFVVYSEKAKCELLGLAQADIDRCGVVSRQVALAMADGALAAAEADIALSITGFAGPGGNDDEAGLIHFGCARRGHATIHREEHFGDIGRGPTRIAALKAALEMMHQAL